MDPEKSHIEIFIDEWMEWLHKFRFAVALPIALLIVVGIPAAIFLFFFVAKPMLAEILKTNDEFTLGFYYVRILVVSFVVIFAVVFCLPYASPHYKAKYAFMAFTLASIFALLLFIPFMASDMEICSPVGVGMVLCIITMGFARIAWPTVKGLWQDGAKKVMGGVKFLLSLTRRIK